MKNWIFTLLLLATALSANATHIVGGSMTHQSLGNNDYLITVEVYRDCYNGQPWFDDPMSIGVFDENNLLVGEYLVPLDSASNDTVSILPANFVCVFPQGVCIHKTVYYEVITLPSTPGKYTVSYQRCCRSVILSNLETPGDIGMTFMTVIDNSLDNSSPIFDQDIPVAIYSNVPFIYDGSATDPDGDSLVYSLSTPFVGADPSNPMPQPPAPPPYDHAIFASPTYSKDNMLGGNYPLVINPATGEFSAIPPTLGAFQIGYKVEEYRNGQLIGTTYREFVFVVVPAEPSINFDVSGRVMLDSFTTLDAGTVQLLQRDVTTDSLYLYNTYTVTNGGDYSFLDIPPGVFYLRAFPDSSSAYFGNYLPTYYRDNFFWYNAITVNQCDTAQFYRDIYLIHTDSFIAGNPVYQLRGTVRNSTDNEVVPYLDLLLADGNGHFYQHTTTDEYGLFEFTAQEGNYTVYVDLWNSAVFNSDLPNVPILPNQQQYAKMTLYPDRLAFDGFTATNEPAKDDNSLNIQPNPSDGQLTVFLPANTIGEGKLTVWNANGALVLTKTTDNTEAVHLNLPTGFYLIGLYTADGIWTGKAVVR